MARCETLGMAFRPVSAVRLGRWLSPRARRGGRPSERRCRCASRIRVRKRRLIRRRAEREGYVFCRGLVPRDRIDALRGHALAVAADLGWLDADAPADAAHGVAGVRLGAYDDPALDRLPEARAAASRRSKRSASRPRRDRRADRNPGHAARVRRGRPVSGRVERRSDHTTVAHQDRFYLPGGAPRWSVWVPLGACPLDLGPLAVLPRSHRARAASARRRCRVAPGRGRRRGRAVGGLGPRARRRDLLQLAHRAPGPAQRERSRAPAVRHVPLPRGGSARAHGGERRRSPDRRASRRSPRCRWRRDSWWLRRGATRSIGRAASPVHPHGAARSRRGGGESSRGPTCSRSRRTRGTSVTRSRSPGARGRGGPGAFVLFGGPSVPRRPERAARFLREHPYVDALAFGEGELLFREVLSRPPRGPAARRRRRPRPPRDRAARGRACSPRRAREWWSSRRQGHPTSTAPSTRS